MFYYFGYGSNINLLALKAKGVVPIHSKRAILKEWKLRFNVKHWFRHECGMGNVVKSNNPLDQVEGMVHFCDDDHLTYLDAMEAYGVGYDRVEVELKTSIGDLKAITYVGLPGFLDENLLPTRRYLNIIIKGAEQAGLSSEYLNKLKNHPTVSMPDYPVFFKPNKNLPVFDESSLMNHPNMTALYGYVFDMSEARPELESVKPVLGGKDMTLFHVKRHDSSDGNETLKDVIDGNISEGAKKYVNAYLNEYDKEFEFVGRYDYKHSI